MWNTDPWKLEGDCAEAGFGVADGGNYFLNATPNQELYASFIHTPETSRTHDNFSQCTDCCEQVWGTVDQVRNFVSWENSYHFGEPYTFGTCADKGFVGTTRLAPYNFDASDPNYKVNY